MEGVVDSPLDMRRAGRAAGAPNAASQNVVLRIVQAEKSYRTKEHGLTVALRPVDAEIREGQFVSLVGPSGCGKTTLLKMCAGLITPTAGQIVFRDTGKPIGPGSYGFVFQAPALLPWRTALRNVMLPADILRLPRKQAQQRAQALLELVQLGAAASKLPRELSGGMQQRVAIARAMLHDPDVLFMDEPFGALDAMTREELNLELQRIQQNERKTVLFVTHDIEEAVLLSDVIFVLSSGPGRLVTTLEVPIERPRRMSHKLSPEFQRIALAIRAILERGHDTDPGPMGAHA